MINVFIIIFCWNVAIFNEKSREIHTQSIEEHGP